MNWKQELRKIKESEVQKKSPKKKLVARAQTPDTLLKQVKAFELLRDMREILLDRVGVIELFEDASGYDLVMALMWDGPIATPKPPRPDSKSRHHIFVGVKGKRLYVNGKVLQKNTEERLQKALLQAAKEPGHLKTLAK